MRPASHIQAVIEIYERIAAAKIPMDAIVGDYMRQRRYIGSKDRADIAERTYNGMRAWNARLIMKRRCADISVMVLPTN